MPSFSTTPRRTIGVSGVAIRCAAIGTKWPSSGAGNAPVVVSKGSERARDPSALGELYCLNAPYRYFAGNCSGEKWEVPEEEYVIPLGIADIKRPGTDVTIIAHGRAVLTSLAAAELLATQHQIEAEVVDLRSIRPLDEETVLNSVRKTHRALVVEESKPFCGVGAQIAATLQEKVFDDLDAPVGRLSSIDAPAIYSPPLERKQLPDPHRVIAKVLEIC